MFELASTENWINVLQTAMSLNPNSRRIVTIRDIFMNSTSELFPLPSHRKSLIRRHSPLQSLYFIAAMSIVSIFTVNMFIGIVLDYIKSKSGLHLLTTDQLKWRDLQREIASLKPSIDRSKVSHYTSSKLKEITKVEALSKILGFVDDIRNFRWVSREYVFFFVEKRGIYNRIILPTILLIHIALLCSAYDESPPIYEYVKLFIYLVLAMVYVHEEIVRLIFVKFKVSFWTIYTPIISFGMLLFNILRIADYRNIYIMYLFAVFGDLYVVRIVQTVPKLQAIFKVLLYSFPAIIKFIFSFFIFILIYAFMFMEVFGLTRYGTFTGEHVNFRDIGVSLLTFFRMMTGESWNLVMHDTIKTAPECTDHNTYLLSDCGNKYPAYIFFPSFYIICTYIFVNLLIAVIIQHFWHVYQDESTFTLITREQFKNFKQNWKVLDPNANGYIPLSSLPDLIKILNTTSGSPFGVGVYYGLTDFHIKNILAKLYNQNESQRGERKGIFRKISISLLKGNKRDDDAVSAISRRSGKSKISSDTKSVNRRSNIPDILIDESDEKRNSTNVEPNNNSKRSSWLDTGSKRNSNALTLNNYLGVLKVPSLPSNSSSLFSSSPTSDLKHNFALIQSIIPIIEHTELTRRKNLREVIHVQCKQRAIMKKIDKMNEPCITFHDLLKILSFHGIFHGSNYTQCRYFLELDDLIQSRWENEFTQRQISIEKVHSMLRMWIHRRRFLRRNE
jgi:hypothetical protein